MSSLELFHSNFLACLFEEDPIAFLNCFRIDNHTNRTNIVLAREYSLGTDVVNGKKKKFITDIMVGIKMNNSKHTIKPLLIIENKIKSYPNNEQLQGQDKLVNKLNNECKKVILSMFPVLQNVLNGTTFVEVKYSTLVNQIRQFYLRNSASSFSGYINDYCDMLDGLTNCLQKYTNIPQSLKQKKFLFPLLFNDLQEISFIDVFRKYQASMLYYDAMKCMKQNGLCQLYGDNAMSNKHAIASFFQTIIQGKIGVPDLSVGVQIEDNQFRIVFFGNKIRNIIKDHKKSIVNIPPVIPDIWNYWFGNGIKGNARKCINGSHNNFCSYSDDFIYRYVNIFDDIETINKNQHSDITFEQLITTGWGKTSKNGETLSIEHVMTYFNTIIPQLSNL